MRINVLSREAITTHNKAVRVGAVGDADVVALIDDYGPDSAGNPVQHWNLHIDIGGGVFYGFGQKHSKTDAEAVPAALAARMVELGHTADGAGFRAWLVGNLRAQWEDNRAIDGATIPFACSRFVMAYLEIVDVNAWSERRAEDDAIHAQRKTNDDKQRAERKAREATDALAAVNATAEALAAGQTVKIVAAVAAVKHHKIEAHPRTLAALAAGRRTDGTDALLRAVADLAPSRVAAEADARADGIDPADLFRTPAQRLAARLPS